ncbi:MAG: diguanylate cyclase, partial [Candidatus Margulisbacteria bacterium]|nr:diguanylate cyclase [Candidatus Margulisiibacteriota bacterium]
GKKGGSQKSKSYLCVPLVSGYNVMGVIYMKDKKNRDSFTPQDMRMISEMSYQIAIGIEHADLYTNAEMLSVQDPLTGLFNRNFFIKSLEKEIQRAKVNDFPISILMLDIDFFKATNDTYGHLIGDEVLKKVSIVFKKMVRKTDMVARYGGEEMISALIGADSDQAFKIAEKVRKKLEELCLFAVQIKMDSGATKYMLVEKELDTKYTCLLFPLHTNPDEMNAKVEKEWIESLWLKKIKRDIEERQKLNVDVGGKLKIGRVKVTASVGIATFPDDFSSLKVGGDEIIEEKSNDADLLFGMSDHALYEAKRFGRNRIFKYQDIQKAMSRKEINHREEIDLEKVMIKLRAFDSELYQHSRRVSNIALDMSKHLGLDADMQNIVKNGALLHDIGKIKFPKSLIQKLKPLTDSEYGKMNQHPSIGAEFLERYVSLHKFINAVRHHHEKWEGFGYPEGIAGSRIPIEARIIAIADHFDALQTKGHYRCLSKPLEGEAMTYIKKYKGILFDPDIVDMLVNNLEDLREARNSSND